MTITRSNININPTLTPARLVSTSNQSGTYYNGNLNNGVGATLTYATGALTIDSVTPNIGDRILLTAQSNENENGIYDLIQAGATGVSAILQRSDDFQDIEQMKAGQYISVAAGTSEAGSMYALIEPLPQFMGISPISFNATITSGLGTAAAKAATDDSKSELASVSGSFTVGNFVAANDTSGTSVDSGFNVNNVLLYASVPLTAAQFKAMYATPMLLVSAPGANKMIIVDRLELVMTYGSAQYTGGGAVAAQYDSTPHSSGVLATNQDNATDYTTASASTTFTFNGSTIAGLFSTTVNKGLYLTNAVASFSTGDSAFVAKVHYRIIATA